MNVEIVEFLEAQGYIWVSTKEHFEDHYPIKKPGEYRARPQEYPDSYPCMVKEAGFYHNPNGQDEFILSYIYF